MKTSCFNKLKGEGKMMSNKDFIEEILKRIDKYSTEAWITDGDEIYTDSESTYYEIVNTLDALGLNDCLCSDSELIDGVQYYGIHFV